VFITSPETERGSRQSKAEQTQERILAAAHDLLDEVGIRRTSVDAVAKRAAVSRGTVYLYFTDKQALV
jgi:AcrR family transcriptional regulator